MSFTMSKKFLATVSLLLSPTCFAFSEPIPTESAHPEAVFLSECAAELASISQEGSWVDTIEKDGNHEHYYKIGEYAYYTSLTYTYNVVKQVSFEGETESLGKIVYKREYDYNLQDAPYISTCKVIPPATVAKPKTTPVAKPKTTPVAKPKIITFGKNRINLKASKGETLKFKITGKQIWDIGGKHLFVRTVGHKRKYDLYVGYGSMPKIGDNSKLCKLDTRGVSRLCVPRLDRYSNKDLYILVHAKQDFSGAHLRTFIKRR